MQQVFTMLEVVCTRKKIVIHRQIHDEERIGHRMC